jgi:predicted nucleic acid-binding protein
MIATKPRIFVDTNILVYAYDRTAEGKHRAARDILRVLWTKRSGVLSTQVIQEFYVSVTKKIPRPIDPGTARTIAGDLLRWDVVVNDGESILEAIDIQTRQKISFWDALIVQSALRGRADVLLSEDLSDGRRIEGLLIQNPFKHPGVISP